MILQYRGDFILHDVDRSIGLHELLRENQAMTDLGEQIEADRSADLRQCLQDGPCQNAILLIRHDHLDLR